MSNPVKPPAKRADQLGFRPKRFWTQADITPVETGISVTLDGRPVRTPSGAVLTLPTRALGQAVAAEWQAVQTHVDYDAMPLTRLGFASIDRMNSLADETIAEVLRYAQTDVVCYPSAYPQSLFAREQVAWLPLLAWAQDELGLQFHQNLTLIHTPQPQPTLDRLEALVRDMSAGERAGLMMAVPVFGSIILALALWRSHVTGEAALAASRIGETFQSDIWGHDAEAAQRIDAIQTLAVNLQTWFEGLKVHD